MTDLTLPVRSLLAALALSLGLLAGCSSTPHYATTPAPKPLTRELGNADDLRIAAGALESGDVQMAGSLYEKVLKADPHSVEANVGLGDCLFQSGDLEGARLSYGRAAVLAPEARAPKLALARVALRQRHFDEASKLYHDLLAQTPDDPAASAGLGTVLDLTDQHKEAQALYRSALAQHPDSMALRIDLGLSLTLGGEPREGANVLLDVAGIPDAPPQARQDLALAYGLLGNDAAAEKILLTELPKNSVQDNLRYYARVRAALNSQPSTPPAAHAAARVNATGAQVVTARGTAVLPRVAQTSLTSSGIADQSRLVQTSEK
jgi:Flp pilus assembly protein TadD